jgi:hypothetical protein
LLIYDAYHNNTPQVLRCRGVPCDVAIAGSPTVADLAPWKTSTSASAGGATADASEAIAVAAMNAASLALALNI